MIDDATIKRVSIENGLFPDGELHESIVLKYVDYNGMMESLTYFARAIEQLARQEQREEDARICAVFTEPTKAKGLDWLAETALHKSGNAFAEAIRAAGKENSND